MNLNYVNRKVKSYTSVEFSFGKKFSHPHLLAFQSLPRASSSRRWHRTSN